MKSNKNKKQEFIDNPKKALWKLSIPMMLGMSVQSIYMLIDTLFIRFKKLYGIIVDY